MNIAGVHLDLRATLPTAKAVIADIEALGGRALFFNTNAADDDKRAKVLNALAAALQESPAGAERGVHVLIHSLAFGSLLPFVPPLDGPGRPEQPVDVVSRAQIEMTLDVMANSLVYWTQDMVQRGLLGAGSRVFAMTSEGSQRAWHYYGAVSAAKAALGAYTRQLALELGPRGILVNTIQAGVTDTPALRKIPGHAAMIDYTLRRNPSGRMTSPEDVAATVVALSRPEVKFVSGSTIFVDGGEAAVG
jgi:NAD(P)-dependent dehydrogenase (short-subunit alcohol dehydrogenase family)